MKKSINLNIKGSRFEFEVLPNKHYLLAGVVSSESDLGSRSALVSFDFDGVELSEHEVKLNRLAASKKYGYFKYLSIIEGDNLFNFLFKTPGGVQKVLVKVVLVKSFSDIQLRSLSLLRNFMADDYMNKNIKSSAASHDNFKKRQIYKDRWLKQLQKNIALKDSFVYRYADITTNALTSFKVFVGWPANAYRLLSIYIKYKGSKLVYGKWYQLKQKPLSKTIKTNHQKIFISGEYCSLDGEKSNAMLIRYDFHKTFDIKLVKALGFSYSEKVGFFNYVDVSKDGQNSFSKSVRIPEGVSKLTISFVNWYSNNKILFKVDNIELPIQDQSVQKVKSQQKQATVSKQQKPKIIYSDELTQQDALSILGWPKVDNSEQKPVVLGVMDEFTTGCFEEDVCLIQPRPDNWLALAKTYKPDLVFIESAWQGNHGSWQFRVANYTNKPGDEIAQLSEYCKQKNIPMIFWNKEDPVHHQKFMCSAELVSHIFTTDANMIPSYIQKTGNSNVQVLPFSAQPSLHKPKPLAGRKQKSCFAGSWYGNRHAERGAMMVWLLEAANEYGLEIYDRNYDRGIMPFPDKYKDGIRGALPYKELCQEYGKYRIFLNVNSVVDSPTMFSRRVFELMACGTPIVSTYAKGIEDFFESDAIWLVKDKQEALEAIKTLMNDDEEWRRRSLLGIREVFSKHTYAHRWNQIFLAVNSEKSINVDPQISLVAIANTQQDIAKLIQMVSTQKYQNFQLYIQTQLDLQALTMPANVQICSDLKEHADIFANYIGWVDSNIEYQEFYLRDIANAFLYEPAAIGWAKSSTDDKFAYAQQTLNNLAIWRKDKFVAEFFDIQNIKKDISCEDLFVIDADQVISYELKNTDKKIAHVHDAKTKTVSKKPKKTRRNNKRRGQ